VVAFDEALSRGSDEPFVYLARGRALIAQGDLTRASADIDHALLLNPKFAAAFAARGLLFMKTRDVSRALEALDHAIALDPRNIETYCARGGIRETQGERDLAIADFRKAIELAPKTFFDTLAQAEAKKHVLALDKQIPCHRTGLGSGETCL
jgi:tetratricopeptide (TPR) repeat protein